MHGEAISGAFNSGETGSIVVDANSNVPILFAIDT